MKRTYIIPALQAAYIAEELPIAQSNEVNNSGIVNLNPTTMDRGDGSDAVKRNDYNVWNDDWSQ